MAKHMQISILWHFYRKQKRKLENKFPFFAGSQRIIVKTEVAMGLSNKSPSYQPRLYV